MKHLNELSTVRLNTSSGQFYYQLAIDGEILENILDRNYPGQNLLGLVPTLLNWLENKDERKCVWERIIPNENEKVLSPILMCNDDLDLWCAVIVAESTCFGAEIIWNRIGVSRGFDDATEREEVNWLDKLGPYIFDKKEFLSCVDLFKRELD